ncbi:MAG TPA: GNAT family N-acetyltransferase, partial [Candidatus Dormibacteraeota bacterium]|nr:GNAT family N-acetyltransferase [Candidatus Dormibacteraeota bacterium]
MITREAPGRPSVLEADDREWVAFAHRHPQATVFHHLAWITVLADSYGFQPGVFALRSAEGDVVGGLPFVRVRSRITGSRLVALPYTDHSPPLSAPGWDVAMGEAIRSWARDAGALEVHARLPLEDGHWVGAGVRHVMPLGDRDAVWNRLAKTPVGRALRKAERSELVASIERDLPALRQFYRLHCLTRRRQGVPVQPWRFFEQLHRQLLSEGLGMIVLARYRGIPVAASMYLAFNLTLIYKYGASDPAYLAMRPNNLVMWRAIEWGCQHGCATIDFGRSDADNIGLRQFKSSWGAQEISNHHTVLPHRARRHDSQFAIKA